jgi:hypothetical protein
MRIQEMRSGSAHLKKKVQPDERDNFFEYHDPREVHQPEPEVETQPAPAVACELEEPRWSVVSFSQVEAGGLTYSQAARLLDELHASGVSGLCLITDDAARKALLT